jgi:uncharacterized protein YecE (DUF72 family)
MEFGKLATVDGIAFSLPPDHPNNAKLSAPARPTRWFVGCPIWACKNWVGQYYPSSAKEKDFLKHYAKQFNTIELNSTHYHLPDASTVARWRDSVPSGFTFCPKVLQSISHDSMLRNTEKLTEHFCYTLQGLDEHLGVCFLQLPSYFSPQHAAFLEAYIAAWPKDVALSVEFRNEAWFKPSITAEETFAMLAERNIGLVITDVAGRRDVLHQRATNTTAAIRFVGNAPHPSDYTRLDEWARKLKSWSSLHSDTVYFWVHEPDNIASPAFVSYFIEALQKLEIASNLQIPKKIFEPTQGFLF